MKSCTLCKKEKPLNEFHKKTGSKDGRQNVCAECKNLHNRNRYKKDPKRHAKQVSDCRSKRRKSIHLKIFEHLSINPCKCGESDPATLEFHHVRGKTELISKLLQNSAPWKRIFQEIKRCEVICANCHRKETAKKFGWYKILLNPKFQNQKCAASSIGRAMHS